MQHCPWSESGARPLTVRPALRVPLNTAECPPAEGYIARRAGPMWLLEQATSRRNTSQLQKAFIEQAAQCDAFNVKGRTMPMTSPYTPGDMLGQSAIIQSSAYIGIAAILAVFIVAFATAPKARAQDNGHHPRHADHHSKWNSQAPTREISLLHETRYVGQSSSYFSGGRDASFAEIPTLHHSPVSANALAVPGMQKSFRLRRGRYGSRALPRD
jgi:hypothetical protein